MLRSKFAAALLGAASLLATSSAFGAEPYRLNEKGYFETRGANVLVFSNWYDGLFADSKISGVEIILKGNRLASNGDVRLMPTPGQWDEIGQMTSRTVDPATGVITTKLRYEKYDFNYTLVAKPVGDGIEVSILLEKPLPEALKGRAGFNLEFIPSAYFHKSFMVDGKAAPFPLAPASDMKSLGEPELLSRKLPKTEPVAMAKGRHFSLSPDAADTRVEITSETGDIALFDGRNQATNGWFVLRGDLPTDQTGTVLKWQIKPAADADWVRAPMIAHSQVGYVPQQKKVAVIELDPNDTPEKTAKLVRINADGSATDVLTAEAKPWGRYLRYDYLTFDFSSVTQEGLYALDYDGQRTLAFRIAKDVYATAWQPTLDVYLPVAMDHVQVNEAYRVWHGDSHRDDALQAPVSVDHIDLYGSKATTDTRFKPLEHIPGLNVGGWYDAGDFDIRTQSQYAVVRGLVQSWERFNITRDTTMVDHENRMVDIHVPDGKADILQQIQHGTLWLVSHFDVFGHAINGVVEPDLTQYPHLGDGVTKTDNLIYDATMKWSEHTSTHSGRKDDRWAFTNKSTALNYGSIAGLAAASRALKGFDDALAAKSLAVAERVWDEEHSHAPIIYEYGNTTGRALLTEELSAGVELLIATKNPKYAKRIMELWPEVEKQFPQHAGLIMQALPYMPKSFKAKVRPAVVKYKETAEKMTAANPFGVPITEGGWAGNGFVIGMAINAEALHREFPDLISLDMMYQGLAYIYGTHPAHNLSFVSGVGARSKEVAYGTNRADFSFIAGGIVPGVLVLKPDFPENREDWPFFWGENEYVINLGASYIYLVNAADQQSRP